MLNAAIDAGVAERLHGKYSTLCAVRKPIVAGHRQAKPRRTSGATKPYSNTATGFDRSRRAITPNFFWLQKVSSCAHASSREIPSKNDCEEKNYRHLY